jgi:hypothetical protein
LNTKPLVIQVSYKDLAGKEHSHTYERFEAPPVDSIPVQLGPSFVERPAIGDWSRLAGLADQWFSAHLQLSIVARNSRTDLSPWAFSAGHAIELYLKAAVAAHESMAKATSFGHKLWSLWRCCEAYEQFPLKGLLRSDLVDLDRDIYSSTARQAFPEDVRRHLSHNELLYLAIRHVQDLKYLGTPGKSLRDGMQLTFASEIPNKVGIGQLGKIAHWVWGQWACRPGYNNASLYQFANQLISQ